MERKRNLERSKKRLMLRDRLKILMDFNGKINALSLNLSSFYSYEYNDIYLDMYVEYKNFQIFVVNVALDKSQLEYEKSRMPLILKKTQFIFGIVIDIDENYYMCQYGKERMTKVNIDDVLKIIKKECSSISLNPSKVKIKSILWDIFQKSGIRNKNNCEQIFQEACTNLEYTNGIIRMHEDDEDKFFCAMLGLEKEKERNVCRYISLDSLCSIFNNQNITMNAPVSMNDGDEGSYADSYMPFYVGKGKMERNLREILNENKIFMLSCSSEDMYDNLNLWRLYGDDSKGVCVKFFVDFSKIDNKRFFFAPINYANEENHPELCFLRDICEAQLGNGWHFIFNKWYCWKYFFKSYGYADEKEVRLLYIPDSKDEHPEYDCYKDRNNGIFNISAKFSLLKNDGFPLSIDGFILGPNSPYSNVNADQIRLMASLSDIKLGNNFSVEKSKIKNYR